MKSFEQIAKAMYGAWAKEYRKHNFDPPLWITLTPAAQAAWIAAARQAVAMRQAPMLAPTRSTV